MENPKQWLQGMLDEKHVAGELRDDFYDLLLAAVETIDDELLNCADCGNDLYPFQANLVENTDEWVCDYDYARRQVLDGITGKTSYAVLQIVLNTNWVDFSAIKSAEDLGRAFAFVRGEVPSDWAGKEFRIVRWDKTPIWTKGEQEPIYNSRQD